jgi:signal transduction histidine kinase
VGLNDLELKIRDQLSFVDCIKSLSAEVGNKTEPTITTKWIRGNNYLTGYGHGHLIIPLVAKGKSVGAIHALVNDQLLLDVRDQELLSNIGWQIGTAVENAMLWKELRQISSLRKEVIVKTIEAQEEERLRIARELHDETSQNISALSLASKTVELAIDNDNPDKARKLLQELRKGISLTIKGIHNIIYDLRPTLLDDKGLIPALRWLAEAKLAEQGVKLDFLVEGEIKRLTSQLEITIFRIAQECVNNISKYAQASEALLKLSFGDDLLVMEIADNGIGFDVDQVITDKSGKSRRGLGLIGMKERASLVGADFKIWSEPGQGTNIRFVVQTSGNGVDSIGENKSFLSG